MVVHVRLLYGGWGISWQPPAQLVRQSITPRSDADFRISVYLFVACCHSNRPDASQLTCVAASAAVVLRIVACDACKKSLVALTAYRWSTEKERLRQSSDRNPVWLRRTNSFSIVHLIISVCIHLLTEQRLELAPCCCWTGDSSCLQSSVTLSHFSCRNRPPQPLAWYLTRTSTIDYFARPRHDKTRHI